MNIDYENVEITGMGKQYKRNEIKIRKGKGKEENKLFSVEFQLAFSTST